MDSSLLTIFLILVCVLVMGYAVYNIRTKRRNKNE